MGTVHAMPAAPKKPQWFKRDKSGAVVFAGETFDDHVQAWGDCQLEVDSGLWGQARIAGSLETKYGEGGVKEFAKEVGKGKTWIYDMAGAFRAFGQNSGQLEYLSFTHHVEAAKDDNPQEALEKAHDGGWSTKQLQHYVETGLEPGEKSGINAAALASAIDPNVPAENIEGVADRAMIAFLTETLGVVSGLVTKCPRPKFASDVLGGWTGDINDHLEQIALHVLKERVIKAWKDGYREEAQIAGVTGIPTSEIHAAMMAYQRDKVFEKVRRTKTAMAKGTAPWIWHLVGEPIGTDANGREFKRPRKKR